MINDLSLTWLAITFAGGIGLGALFFGGLWLTTSTLHKTNANPALLIISFVLRVSLVLLGFYWLTAADWRYVLTCMSGFLIARFVVIRTVIAERVNHDPSEQVTS